MRALRSTVVVISAVVGIGLVAYAGWIAATWLNYGRPEVARDASWSDPLLDQFMPYYDVVERHRVRVAAPPGLALVAAKEMDLNRAWIVRTIFKARETILGARPSNREIPKGLLAETLSLGWGILAEVPGREVVVGAVTQPWESDVVFRALPPDQFAAFREPGYVKIAWTLRADPVDALHSDAVTETRAIATDPIARSKFRLYWACVSPGIVLIRRISLDLVRDDAERRAKRAMGALIATSEE